MHKVFSLASLTLALIGLAPFAPARGDDKDKAKPEIEVPYVPTPEKVVTAMLKLGDVKEGDTVYDLGCGDGRIVICAVKDFKAKKGLGLDYNPERLKDCHDRVKKEMLTDAQAKKLEFKQGDVLKMTPEDFKDVDVVTLYLYPSVNLRLKPILQKGLKPGARVVSHAFDMGEDWKPEKTERVDDSHTIYLWTIKK
jgi:SAM-dependent methyltransferase